MKKTNSSMQLTRAADYAVRVMIHLAAHRRRGPPLPPGAGPGHRRARQLPLQGLAGPRPCRLHLLPPRSVRRFHHRARGLHASMLQVIEAIDGPICLNVCLISGRVLPSQRQVPRPPRLGSGAARHARPCSPRPPSPSSPPIPIPAAATPPPAPWSPSPASPRPPHLLTQSTLATHSLNQPAQFSRTPARQFAKSPPQCFNRIIETGVLHALWG